VSSSSATASSTTSLSRASFVAALAGVGAARASSWAALVTSIAGPSTVMPGPAVGAIADIEFSSIFVWVKCKVDCIDPEVNPVWANSESTKWVEAVARPWRSSPRGAYSFCTRTCSLPNSKLLPGSRAEAMSGILHAASRMELRNPSACPSANSFILLASSSLEQWTVASTTTLPCLSSTSTLSNGAHRLMATVSCMRCRRVANISGEATSLSKSKPSKANCTNVTTPTCIFSFPPSSVSLENAASSLCLVVKARSSSNASLSSHACCLVSSTRSSDAPKAAGGSTSMATSSSAGSAAVSSAAV